MNEEQFKAAAKERIKAIVNYISQNEFDKLSSITLIERSWCGDSGTQTEGIETFAKWLKEQLELWEEDFGHEFVVDPYDEKGLSIGILENGRSFATYNPTSHGEEIDFWFEIKLYLKENDKLISKFNINT